MSRISKKEAERREKSAIEFFHDSPNASVADLNKAFADGSLTGKKEPTMNIKRAYILRKKARTAVAEAQTPPSLPASAARRPGGSLAVSGGTADLNTYPSLGKLLQAVAVELAKTPFEDVSVTRRGEVKAGLMARQEQSMTVKVPA